MPNSILFYPDHQGVILQKFCPEAEAREFLEATARQCGVGSAIISDSDDLEFVYRVSPKLRDHAEQVKAGLSKQMRIKVALDRQGVPLEQGLRAKISAALLELGV